MSISSRLTAAVLALALGATACTDDASAPVSGSGPDSGSATSPGSGSGVDPVTDLSGQRVELTSALETVGSCDALLGHLQSVGMDKVGPYGFNNQPFLGISDEALETGAVEADTVSDDASGNFATESARVEAPDSVDEGDRFSGTNNQEVGVDEADLVKTDGERIVVLSNNELRIIDATAEEPTLVDTVRLPDDVWGNELFLRGDKALLMGSGWTAYPLDSQIAAESFVEYGLQTGRIIEVDLNSATVERTLEFEGSYLSAREVDGTIRVVVSAVESRFPFLFPSGPEAEETATETNQRLIAESTIDQWLPSYRLIEGAPNETRDANTVIDEGPLVACDRVHIPANFAGFGSIAVLTVDIDDGLSIDDSLSVFTDGETVYSSTDRLTVATPRWPEFNDDGTPVEDDDYRTALHSFDITDPTGTTYTASGSVKGYLLSQYSLSEHEGYLRVATTERGGRWWGWGRVEGDESESFVTVLAEDSGDLVQVGQVGGLGIGEQIQSVRFMGDLGYVITFEQIDPLYAIDLRDPSNPTVLDELKIEGFSAYLHPVGDGKLLGIGPDGTADGLTFGVVASLFDVSDPTDISRAVKLPIGLDIRPDQLGPNQWVSSSTNLQWDPKSFTFFDGKALIPLQWNGYQDASEGFVNLNGAAVVIVEVDADGNTLRTVGRVGHPVQQECEAGGRPEVTNGTVIVSRSDFGDIDTIDDLVALQNGEDLETSTGAEDSAAEDAEGSEADAGNAAETDAEAGDAADAEAGFATSNEPVAVEEPAALTIAPGDDFCFSYQPVINRSVIIGNRLFTVSDSGVGVNDFDSLDPVAWIPFQ